MAKIGFIGMGNMGYAMMCGCLNAFGRDEIVFSELNTTRAEQVTEETGVVVAASNTDCVKRVKYLVLAVKPQFYASLLKDIQEAVTADQVIISIAPGITIADLQEALGNDKKIVRAMPNTPALIGEGMTGICYDETLFSEEELNVVEQFFKGFGEVQVVSEKLMNAVVCVSGSSPAYVYILIEALADSAVKYGMPRSMAYEFAAKTVAGSAEMVLKTGKHPGELKDMVCSPAGTTIAGVAALEESGFRNAVIKAADACYKKCEELK